MSRYRVDFCANCEHPGGQHRRNTAQACVLCDCSGWTEPAKRGYWSDEEQWRAERERAAELRRRPALASVAADSLPGWEEVQ